MTLEDESAVLARIETDPEAFGEIFDEYYPVIIKYLVRRTGSYAVAEDMASATFVRALTRIDTYEPRGISILAWLYRIAGNALKDYYRSASRYAGNLDDDAIMCIANATVVDESIVLQEQLDRERDFHHALAVLNTLPEKYREVILLHYTEGLKIREIAAATGRREGTVKSILSRGMKRLAKACNQQGTPSLYRIGSGNYNATPKGHYEA